MRSHARADSGCSGFAKTAGGLETGEVKGNTHFRAPQDLQGSTQALTVLFEAE
jgi:hypothetical protein